MICSNYRTNFQPVDVVDVLFRYSFTTYGVDGLEGGWRRAVRFGWEVSNQLTPVFMRGVNSGFLPSSTGFCYVDKPNVLLLTMKKAEDGAGIILRLMETEGVKTTTTLRFRFLRIVKAYITNLVEEDVNPLTVRGNSIRIQIKPFGMATVRIITEDSD